MENNKDKYSVMSLKNPVSRLALMVAKIMLSFNVVVFEFIELLKYHLVMETQRQEPQYSIVQISARTQLDRRQVSKIFNHEQGKQKRSRVALVLQELRHICSVKNTDTVTKINFDAVRKQLSSGALTTAAIAKELLRQQHIIDCGKKYKIFNKAELTFNNELDCYYVTRRVFNELNAYCMKNNTDLIAINGDEDSFWAIYQKHHIKGQSIESIADYLIHSGNIKPHGGYYQLQNWRYTSKVDASNLFLLTRELNRLADTILHNIDSDAITAKKIQRTIYSSQIEVEKCAKVLAEIKALFEKSIEQVFKILASHESNVERNVFPKIGLSMYFFEDERVDDYL